jgi:hypothetical protein
MLGFKEWVDETVKKRGMKGKYTPTRFFKFISADTEHSIQNIQQLVLHNKIRLSGRASFNDPFDSRFVLDAPESADEIIAYLQDLHARQGVSAPTQQEIEEVRNDPDGRMADIRNQANYALDRWGLYSLTDLVDHPLMWAHYANSHKGIAIVFKNMLPLAPFPMRYDTTFPRCTLSSKKSIEIYRAWEKGEQWSYEEEWRIVRQEAAGAHIEIPDNCLHGIVLGAALFHTKLGETTHAMLSEMIDQRARSGFSSVKIYRARVVESFDLLFEELNETGNWQIADDKDLRGVRGR